MNDTNAISNGDAMPQFSTKQGKVPTMAKTNDVPPMSAAAMPGGKVRGQFPVPPAGNTKPRVSFGTIRTAAGHRVCMYGTGGIGKTTMACQMPAPVAFVDLDDSLPVLKARLDEQGFGGNVSPVDGVTDWGTLIAALNADGWDSIKTIVIDTATRAEKMCEDWIITTVPNEKGAKVANIEGYGFGKGYVIKEREFAKLLAALDKHAREGRNVVLICHDCVSNVPNPGGDDWLRSEPRLQNPQGGKASIRAAVKEWCDHLLFVGYDVAADKGKAKGSGTRTMYTAERPHCMAKSRTTTDAIPLADGAFDWSVIFR